MNEEKSYIPSLTLDPQAAAAAQQAPEPEEKKADITPEKPELSKLSEAEQNAVRSFSQQIDVSNAEQIMNYGSAAQKNISEFSDAALSSVKTKDLGRWAICSAALWWSSRASTSTRRRSGASLACSKRQASPLRS